MKADEILFFIASNEFMKSNTSMRNIVNFVNAIWDIPIKRCWYYLRKWSDLGFYSYGVSLDLGWFYPDRFPDRYKYLLNQEKDQDGYKATNIYIDELVKLARKVN